MESSVDNDKTLGRALGPFERESSEDFDLRYRSQGPSRTPENAVHLFLNRMLAIRGSGSIVVVTPRAVLDFLLTYLYRT